MKILMLGRPEMMANYGGDRIQVENTADQLRKLGVVVDISTDIDADMREYDVVHVFQLDWNPSCFFYITNAKKLNKPVVFSPIHHNLKEVERFDREYTFDFRRISKLFIQNQFHRDLLKDMYRTILEPEKLPLTAYSLTHGLKNMYKQAIEMSDIILVQTELEADDMKQVFNTDFKWTQVVNGVGAQFLNTQQFVNKFEIKDYLACVGRVEPRKNQLSVIEAVSSLRDETGDDIKIVFIGAKSKNKHFEYNWRFNNYLKKYNWIYHYPFIPYDEMPSVYKFCKAGVSASWFETTGLTSLEALICGANAVASGAQAKEYLGDFAYYCDPGDINSIKSAISKAYKLPVKDLPEEYKNRYTWANAAEKTLEVYNSLL